MPARRLTLGFAVAIALVAAGCITPGSDVDPQDTALPEDWWARVLPSSLTDADHAHADRAHHANLTTPNFEVLGWDPLVTEQFNETVTGMGCGGAVTREDGLRLAIVHSISTEMAFVVADVTDPQAPRMVGEFYMPNAVIWDADITEDGMHVVVGAYPSGVFGGSTVPKLPVEDGDADADAKRADLRIIYRDACTGEERDISPGPEHYLPYGPGLVLVGIQDPSNPVFEDWVPQPVIGPHSVGSAEVDGRQVATSSVTNLVHQASYYSFFEVEEVNGRGKLVPLSVVRVPGTPPPTALNGHVDVEIHEHPVTGQVLAYLANWDGMYVYDITDPRVPVEVGMWQDGDAGSVHTTYPFPSMWGDRFYLAVGQEVTEPAYLPSGWVYVLDVTDPANPEEVGRWTLPVKPKWDNGGLQFSPHYVGVQNETMFVSNYHGGLWAVNISDPTIPRASGLFVPESASPAPYGGDEHGPSIGDVIVDQETHVLTTWDGAGGVYQLRFHEDVPVPLAPPWGTESDH